MMPTLATDRLLIRAGARSTRYLHVSVRAPAAPPREGRLPLTVAFVLDRSGSMAGEKLRLAKQAVDAAVRMLRPQDRFAVVVYDDTVDTVLSTRAATADARLEAVERLARVQSGGATDLATGWLRGCEQIAEDASSSKTVRCLLLSDGHANRGITDRDELGDRAAQLRAAHVVTSTFGVGDGFDERLMTQMAHAGGGNAYFIEQAAQITDLLTSELGEALEVVARRAAVELDLPAGVEATVMHDLRWTRSGGTLRVELNDLVSEQDVSFIVELRFPGGLVEERVTVRARVSSSDETLVGRSEIAWTYAEDEATERQPRDVSVDRRVAEIDAARARRAAVESNRAGDYASAVRALEGSAERIRGYAGGDPEMQRLLSSLAAQRPTVIERMDGLELKKMHYASRATATMRDSMGRASRGSVVERRPAEERLPVAEADGHLFVTLADGRRFLIATGSPATLADEVRVAVGGVQVDALRSIGPVTLEAIRREIAAPIDGLLGMDVLGRLFWTLDVPNGMLFVSSEPMRQPGERVSYQSIGGIPVIRFADEAGTARAFLDTGAWLSYMPVGDVAGREPGGTREDFVLLPTPMRFGTNLYRRTISLAGEEMTSEFGVLPREVVMAGMTPGHWIIGAQLLARRAFSFNPKHQTVIFGTRSVNLAHKNSTREERTPSPA